MESALVAINLLLHHWFSKIGLLNNVVIFAIVVLMVLLLRFNDTCSWFILVVDVGEFGSCLCIPDVLLHNIDCHAVGSMRAFLQIVDVKKDFVLAM